MCKKCDDIITCAGSGHNLRPVKFRCNIFIGVRIIKEMPGSVASGTHCKTPYFVWDLWGAKWHGNNFYF